MNECRKGVLNNNQRHLFFVKEEIESVFLLVFPICDWIIRSQDI